jgi:hypothetical protein
MDLIALYLQIEQLTPIFSKSMPIWLHISLSQETAPLLRVAESVNTRLCVKLLESRSSKLSKLPLTPCHRGSISLASRRTAEEICILISDLYCSTTHYVRTSSNERSRLRGESTALGRTWGWIFAPCLYEMGPCEK